MLSVLFGGEKTKEAMDGHFKQPSKRDFSHECNLSARWKIWKQTMNLYLKVAMGKKYRNEQCRAVFYVIGLEARNEVLIIIW